MIGKLCTGTLDAYAFVRGNDPSLPRTHINPGLWRVLTPNFEDCSAICSGWELFDVWVVAPVSTRTEAPPIVPLIVDVSNRTVRQGPLGGIIPQSLFKILKSLAEQHVAGNPVVSLDALARLYTKDTPPGTVRANLSSLNSQLHKIGIAAGRQPSAIMNERLTGYALTFPSGGVLVE
jgi:hypothetical protein